MKILIDNGHGVQTPGKRSPDQRLLEWQWTRMVARRVRDELVKAGADAQLLVTEDDDVPLRQRVARANAISGPAVLVSIHANAAGRGQWMTARGWCVLVSPNASTTSKRLASTLAQAAENQGLKVRRPAPEQDYWVQNLAICRDTRCPAVLTENLFMDNKQDLNIMLSTEGFDQIVRTHVEALLQFLRS